MAQALWVRTIRHNRIDQQVSVPCEDRAEPQSALEEACRKLDLSKPVWLQKNQREWDSFGLTRFMPDAFLESVTFDRMDIEFIDPEAKKSARRDPRNE